MILEADLDTLLSCLALFGLTLAFGFSTRLAGARGRWPGRLEPERGATNR